VPGVHFRHSTTKKLAMTPTDTPASIAAASPHGAADPAISESAALPNRAYTSHDDWLKERDTVIAQTWVGLGFSNDIAEPGSVFPIMFMGLPLVMVRDQQGRARVFHNVCRHRGMQLVAEAGDAGLVIRCPYHKWGYDLSGQLKTTPNIGGMGVHEVAGFDCADHALTGVRCDESMGVVFINLSGDAPSLPAHLEPLLSRWRELAGPEFDQQLIADASEFGSMELVLNSNYKLAVENYCESYHLPFVHPDLNTYSPLDAHYNLTVDPLASGQGTRVYDLTRGDSEPLPQFSEWDSERLKTAEYLSLYPNVLLGVQADHFFVILLLSEAVDQTRERLQFLYADSGAIGDSHRERRESLHAAWSVVFAEDISVVEGMQRGRASPAFDGGLFTPLMDIPTHHFHQWFLSRLGKNTTRAVN
jgi:choline monooxygenase